MEIELYRAVLVVEKKKIKLTKAVARQFPLIDGYTRLRKAQTGQEAEEPIAKVRAQALKHPDASELAGGWFYLVEEEEGGLAWTPAITPMAKYAEKIIEHGGWVDHPENVPTIIL